VRIGIATDHGGFDMKEGIARHIKAANHEVIDFGALREVPEDDYPDYIIPLAQAVVAGDVERGIALCSSGVGVSIAANKIAGVRAGLTHDMFSAHQGVEDDNMNIMCLGGRVIGLALALDLVDVFLTARFSDAPRQRRRLAMVAALEADFEHR
jgi:ribose 5-phosphate isomerase B